MSEKVLVVPRKELFTHGAFQGISTDHNRQILKIIDAKSFFMDRALAEEDPTHKQIIPYVMITRGNRIFKVTRLSTQGERRLHYKASIGLGGHINPEDQKPNENPWEAGLKRELSEEVAFTGQWASKLVGMLNDDQTAVGAVHFGMVYRVDVESGELVIQEKDKMTGGFFTPDEVALFYRRMESWSQLLFYRFWPGFVNLVNLELASNP